MPFVHVQTNVTVTPEKAETLEHALGRAISLLPGKSEQWLMCCVEGGSAMMFQGSTAPCAFTEVKLYGRAERNSCDRFAAEVAGLLERELGIETSRCYTRFTDGDKWAWGESLF